MEREHRFGGAWTEIKLQALQEYLQQYTTALKFRRFSLHYIDGFAGTGSYVRRSGGGERAGSAKIALETPGFAHYHLVEKQRARCRILRRLKNSYPSKDVHVVEGDANAYIRSLCRSTNWDSSRAVLFLDPYGMQVEWETLVEISRTKAIDCWFLFPLFGVTRQLTMRDNRLDEDKVRSLDRVFGCGDWRQAFYSQVRQTTLFPGDDGYALRSASNLQIMDWITGRMKEIFPLVVGPEVLRRGHRGKLTGGPALFALYFLCANDSVKARAVAKPIAEGVLKKLKREASET